MESDPYWYGFCTYGCYMELCIFGDRYDTIMK